MPDWYPDWTDQPTIIVASGPSAILQPLNLAHGRAKVVAINNSWRLAPWADALYASDEAWWQSGSGAEFEGLKVSRSAVDGVHKVDLIEVSPDRYDDHIIMTPGVVGSGANGGFQALNLALQWGARDIALIGFDCRVDFGSHWHGDHEGLSNPMDCTALMWRNKLDAVAPDIAALGARVVNCSEVSTLSAYPRMRLEEWLDAQSYDAPA